MSAVSAQAVSNDSSGYNPYRQSGTAQSFREMNSCSYFCYNNY